MNYSSYRVNKKIKIFTSNLGYAFKPAFSIILWSLVFFIGSLLKEPHLFRSITFVPIALGLQLCSNIVKIHRSDPLFGS